MEYTCRNDAKPTDWLRKLKISELAFEEIGSWQPTEEERMRNHLGEENYLLMDKDSIVIYPWEDSSNINIPFEKDNNWSKYKSPFYYALNSFEIGYYYIDKIKELVPFCFIINTPKGNIISSFPNPMNHTGISMSRYYESLSGFGQVYNVTYINSLVVDEKYSKKINKEFNTLVNTTNMSYE